MRRGKLSRPESLCPTVMDICGAADRTASLMASSCAALRGENLPTQATAATPAASHSLTAAGKEVVRRGLTSTPR